MHKIISLPTPNGVNNDALLTVNEVRAVSGCESFTDEQAHAAAETIVTFATLIVNNLIRGSNQPESNHSILPDIHNIAA